MRMLAIMAILLFSAPVFGAAPEGKVEAQLTTMEDVWVGQLVPLTIKILAPGFSISGIPAFEIPEISGLLVLKRPGSPQIGSETLNDVSYVTQVHEFALFPQRAGQFQIHPFPVRFASSAGYGQPVTSFTKKTEPLQFIARLPPGAETLKTLISTSQLTLKESWSPDVETAKVGDAITRTITFKAEEIPGMEFPPLSVDPIDGVGIYPKQPRVKDDNQRGSLRGERVETVTFIFEKPGSATLPGYSLTWFNLATKELKHETLPERTISVTASDSTAGRPHSPSARSQIHTTNWLAGFAILTGAIAVFAYFFWNRKTVPINQEAALFETLKSACRAGDHKRILNALTAWVEHTSTTSVPVMLHQWAMQTGDRELIALITQLESEFYQRPQQALAAPFSGTQLLACLVRFRRRRSHFQRGRADHSALAPLNPR